MEAEEAAAKATRTVKGTRTIKAAGVVKAAATSSEPWLTSPAARTLTAEAEFVLSCARRYAGQESMERVRALVRAAPEWERVLATARWHGIIPLLHSCIVEGGFTDIPSEVRSAIDAEFLRLAADGLLYARELARIMVCLETADVPAIAFKGPALAIALCGKASLRQCRDLDVLVAKEQIPKALERLRSCGYEHDHDSQDAGRLWRTEKDFLLVHGESRFKVELHWAVAAPSFYVRMPFDDIWRRRASISVLENRVAVPHPEDLVLLLCVHGTRHCWAALKWICDIAGVVQKYPEIDWGRLCARARDLGCLRMLLIGLALAREVIRIDLPVEIERALERDRAVDAISADLSARLLSKTETWFDFERTLCYVRSHERWWDRIRMVGSYIGRNLKPDVRDREFIRLPASLVPLYLPLRIGRVLYRHWSDTGRPLLASLMHRNAH
jgi:hypothetical protein